MKNGISPSMENMAYSNWHSYNTSLYVPVSCSRKEKHFSLRLDPQSRHSHVT